MAQRTVDQAKAELADIKASMAYAFAMGHGCSIGDHPEFRAIRRKVADLGAFIHEHGG